MWNALNYLPPIGLPALMFYFFSYRPLRRVRRAKSWRQMPCVIVSSSVAEDQTDSGLYRIDVTYQYRLDGNVYRGDRYSFSAASATAGRFLKRRAVRRRLTPGTATTCWVNPDDPFDAVIDRGATWDMVFMGALALLFLGVFLFLFRHGAVFVD